MRPNPHGLALATLSVLFCGVATAQSKPLPSDRAPGAATIDKQELKTWLTKLTSKEFGGRGTGQPGFQLAADYIKDHFKALGLKPGSKDGKYFQAVPWTMTGPDKATWKFSIEKGGQSVHGVGLENVHGNLGKSVEASGKGMVAIVDDLDDAGLDEHELEGTVLFLVVTDESAGPRTRARGIRELQTDARRAGAGAVILVDQVTYDGTPRLTGGVTAGRGRAARGRFLRPNSFAIGDAEFARLTEAIGKDHKKMLGSEGVVPLGANVQVHIDAKKMQAPAYNVLGLLEGSDPRLKDEYVVIGCHLDHLGTRRGTIYPGADDDGSGSVGLMAIAQAFAKNGKRPRRSIMFTAFCGEEMGLIGSGYFAKNPPMKLSQIVAELQIDMIGRDETGQRGTEKAADNKNSVHLIGTKKLSQDLHDLCLRLNKKRARLDLEFDEENVFYRSDHWNFAKYGVPIAFFFTGFHADYHRPTDTVEKINFDKLARIARYVYDIGFELADASQRPLIEADRWKKLRRKGSKDPAAPVRGVK
jgi:Peptidase family M28